MQRKKKLGLSGLIVLSQLSCVHPKIQLDSELNSWLGLHPDQLVERWGAPASVYTLEKGNKVLSYKGSDTSSRSFGLYRRPDYYTVTESCTVSFITDPTSKVIEKFSYSGTFDVCLDMVPLPTSSP